MNTKSLLSTTILAASCFLLSPVMAQTADGETPAEEDVCASAGLEGPLKGLCNAYCEAMDCDSANPYANENACAKVAANFEKHDVDGVGLPCVAQCPAIEKWENDLGAGDIRTVKDRFPDSTLECRAFTPSTVDVTGRSNTGREYQFLITPSVFGDIAHPDSSRPLFDTEPLMMSADERNACRAYLRGLFPDECAGLTDE